MNWPQCHIFAFDQLLLFYILLAVFYQINQTFFQSRIALFCFEFAVKNETSQNCAFHCDMDATSVSVRTALLSIYSCVISIYDRIWIAKCQNKSAVFMHVLNLELQKHDGLMHCNDSYGEMCYVCSH